VSGYTDGGEGHGASPTSRRRAELRDASGLSVTQKQWIVANIDGHGESGCTQDDAWSDYRAVGIQDSTYTGSRNSAHRDGLVVTLDEERGGQAVYVTPRYVLGRKVRPYLPNTHRSRSVPRAVLDAVERLERIIGAGEGRLFPDPVDMTDIRTLITYLKEQ
jgi:hypothetical protein